MEAREAHIAEIKKEDFHKQYERAVIDVTVKEKLFENMGRTAETEEVKRLGNFEIPEFETRGRGNSKENISRVMFILDSLSDDALNDMAYEFYKKGWILLLLKNVKFKILQKDFFNWAKKNNIKLEVNFTEWRRMVDKKDSLLTPVNEKKLL